MGTDSAAIEEALRAADLPMRAAAWDPIMLADDLTPAQRAAVEPLASRPGLRMVGRLIPQQAWVRRRWLGLDPAGPWEELVPFVDGERKQVPLWRAYRILQNGDVEQAYALFRNLGWPLTKRLEALGDAALGAYEIDYAGLPWGSVDEIHDQGKSWAPRFAERLVELLRTGDHAFFGDREKLYLPLFLALVRAGVIIAPEWDQFLPVCGTIEHVRQCLRALPTERRWPALLRAFRGRTDGTAARVTFQLLPDFPSLEMARFVVENAKQVDKPTAVMAALKKLAERHPELAPVVGWPKVQPKPPKPLMLSCARVVEPRRVEELTPLQQKQLEVAGKEYDGLALDAAERLNPDSVRADSFAASLQIREIVDDKGKHAYDEYRYLDSGAVFRAGTTEIVGRVIQHNLQCDDALLEAAMQICELPTRSGKPRARGRQRRSPK